MNLKNNKIDIRSIKAMLFIILIGFIFFLRSYISSNYQHLVPHLFYFAIPTLLALLYSIILTYVFMFITSKFKIVDKPAGRKAHKNPIPLLGGLAIYLAFISVYFLYNHWSIQTKGILLGGTIILVIGTLDDIWPLSSTIRLFAQMSASFIVMSTGLIVSFMPDTILGNIIATVITLFWFLGIINATNFADGMDGLAAGFTIIASLFFLLITLHLNQFYVTLMATILIGSCLGFLFFNFKPAKIYLGDGGSTFLGFMLASFALYGEWSFRGPVIALGIPILILGVLIFDMIYITISRVRNGHVHNFREWLDYTGRDHFHHRLVNLGFGEKGAVVFIYIISIVLGLSALVLEHARTSYPVLILMVQAVLIFISISILMLVGRKVE